MSLPLFSILLLSQTPSTIVAGDERLVWADLDQDGRLDVVALDPDGLRLLHNEGDGSLADWTERVGLSGVTGAIDASVLDVNGDAVPDLLVLVPNAQSRLFLQVEGVFEDSGSTSGLDLGPGIVRKRWTDWNDDGLPDLSLRGRGVECFYENLGRATFRELLSVAIPTAAPLDQRRLPDVGRPTVNDPVRAVGGPPDTGNAGGPPGWSTKVPGGPPILDSGICASELTDVATGFCLSASSVPVLGMLYPLGPEFMIDAMGFVGIGTTNPGARLDVAGSVRAADMTLLEPTGPPMKVASSTKVAGLNVDLLDGLDSSVFSQLGPMIEGLEILDGTITDLDVSLVAGIAGTKIDADFGAQDVTTDSRVVVNGGAGADAQISVQATTLDGLRAATTLGTGIGVGGYATSGTGVTEGVHGESSSSLGTGVKGVSTTPIGLGIGVRGESASISGYGVLGINSASSGQTTGVYGGTNSVEGTGVYGQAAATTGTTYGVRGESDSSQFGVGVLGHATSPTGFGTGVSGSVVSPDGIGVAGASSATSGFARGVVGSVISPIGTAVEGRALAPTGSSVGVYGETSSFDGVGVGGIHSGPNANLNTSHGVFGAVGANGGTGIWGQGHPNTLSDGVHGLAQNSGGYGVYGVGQNGANGVVGGSSTGDAVRAIGDFSATGTKSFAQPHPTDPSREIRFVCLEGNESGTYFRGTGQLIGGATVIEVPEAFRLVTAAEGLTVQLTAVGAPTQLWVEARDLESIVVRGDLDCTFDYFVNGVRRGFENYDPIRENRVFRPRIADEPWGSFLPDLLRQDLVQSGILNADFTPNRALAQELGWELVESRERPVREQPDRAIRSPGFPGSAQER